MADAEGKLSAFILMPFDEESTLVFNQLISVPLEEVGYTVRRADSVIDQRSVLSDIVLGINGADLIVADLTDLNPNVFYELGIAHGLGVPTVLITQSLEEIPFDLRSYRASEYSTRFDEAEKLKVFLREVGEQAATGDVEFASPVSDFLRESPAAQRLAAKGEIPAPSPRESKVLPEQDQDEAEEEDEGEPGALDLIHRYVQSAEQATEIIGRFGSETALMGEKFARHTQRMEEAMSSSQPGSVAQVHRIATDVAADIDAYGDHLHQDLPLLEDASETMITSGLDWLTTVGPDQEPADLEAFRISLAVMYLTLAESIPQSRSYRDSFREIRGVTSKLNKTADRVSSLLDRMLTVMEKTQSFASRGADIAQEILGADELHFVVEPAIPSYKDEAATEENPFQAVLLSTFDRGVTEHALPQAGDLLQKHSVVTWDIDDSRSYPASWYRHPYLQTVLKGWEESGAFSGREVAAGVGAEE